MLFSIIIPMYNVELYIERCLKSILNQSYNNYELILIDDGSTDDTVRIAESVTESDTIPRIPIKIVKKQNSGASDTRNMGLRYATGKYVIFMDSDDAMIPGSLKVMADAAKTEADLYVFSLKKKMNKDIVESTLTSIEPFSINRENSLDVIEEYLRKTNFKITWQPWAKLFRRDIIENSNVRFDSRLHSCNDFNFFFSYFLFVQSVEFVNIPTVIYTVDRVGSISTTKMMRRIISNTFAYAKFFNDVKRIDDSKDSLLDYASHLYLCALHLCGNVSRTELATIKSLVAENRKIYEYSKRKTSIIRRGLFYILGLKNGALVYARIRSIACSIFRLKRESDL